MLSNWISNGSKHLLQPIGVKSHPCARLLTALGLKGSLFVVVGPLGVGTMPWSTNVGRFRSKFFGSCFSHKTLIEFHMDQ
ncbi:hypothetical protein NPIL_79921 [Nephila pilipes]|uniref:Uncharacterized protein n=1 Tax=Nephila pilipes TaxID=299642 RepID=A0A8X6P639_NEPPI|nr:hypothetical protein NPIL_79921 [Nephila pilipes]